MTVAFSSEPRDFSFLTSQKMPEIWILMWNFKILAQSWQSPWCPNRAWLRTCGQPPGDASWSSSETIISSWHDRTVKYKYFETGLVSFRNIFDKMYLFKGWWVKICVGKTTVRHWTGTVVSFYLPFDLCDDCTWPQTCPSTLEFQRGTEQKLQSASGMGCTFSNFNPWLAWSFLKPCAAFLSSPTKCQRS